MMQNCGLYGLTDEGRMIQMLHSLSSVINICLVCLFVTLTVILPYDQLCRGAAAPT